MTDLSKKDRMQIELTVHRIDNALGGRVPRRKRREIRDELRANLTDAAGRVGAEEAIRQLGDLGTLSKSYVELYRGAWDFRAGWIAMLATYAVIGVLSLVISFAFSAGVTAGGGHPASYQLWSWFGPFQGSASAHSYEVTIGSPGQLVLMALAFVLGARYRSLVRRRS